MTKKKKIVDREYQLVEILVDSVWFKTLVRTHTCIHVLSLVYKLV